MRHDAPVVRLGEGPLRPGEPRLDPARSTAWRAIGALLACAARFVWRVARRNLHQPPAGVGRELRFADGSTARVYRVTVSDHQAPREPTLLVVSFRLRGVRREWEHATFRVESVCNTLLFAGFPGFVSKRWLDHDQNGVYRGIYQWDGEARAAAYVGALWWPLALVSANGSIHATIVPGVRTDEALVSPALLGSVPGAGEWWRPV